MNIGLAVFLSFRYLADGYTFPIKFEKGFKIVGQNIEVNLGSPIPALPLPGSPPLPLPQSSSPAMPPPQRRFE